MARRKQNPHVKRRVSKAEGVKRAHPYRPVTADLITNKLLFQKLVGELTRDINPDLLFQCAAIGVLQEASEAYLADLFEDSILCATHGKRLIVLSKDMKLAWRIREKSSMAA
ncbi:histone H3.X-like [Aulostomus maculatus]